MVGRRAAGRRATWRSGAVRGMVGMGNDERPRPRLHRGSGSGGSGGVGVAAAAV